MEKLLSSFSYKLQHLCSCLIYKFYCFCKSTWYLITYFYQHVLLRTDTFFIQLIFYLSFSSLGFCLLMATKPRTTIDHNGSEPSNLDLFYTSVSAVTTSSMSVIEMESFSDNQLVILILLMFFGGEVCISMLGLHFGRIPTLRQRVLREEGKVVHSIPHSNSLELSSVVTVVPPDTSDRLRVDGEDHLKYKSTKFLGLVVLIFLLVNHIFGFVFVSVYLALFSSAKSVLETKGIKTLTFIVFVTVSTFSGCGFLPTNESMIVFNKNSGLLLSLIPQILLGNTLFPLGLRFYVWVLGKLFKKEEADYLLRNEREVRYFHWLTARHLWLLAASVFGFVLVQFVMLSAMEWSSNKGLSGMNSYERLVALLFQSVSTRYAGENVIDLSKVAPAMWVLFILMMYLPPRTCFDVGAKDVDRGKKRRGKLMENLLFSQLSYLVIAIIIICITEREKIQKDPINFNIFNIVVEVISAYGNVGYTMGYSCELQMNRDVKCVNKSYGFSGRWSNEGKSILILVMLFGRLKKYSMDGGKAWKLS